MKLEGHFLRIVLEEPIVIFFDGSNKAFGLQRGVCMPGERHTDGGMFKRGKVLWTTQNDCVRCLLILGLEEG